MQLQFPHHPYSGFIVFRLHVGGASGHIFAYFPFPSASYKKHFVLKNEFILATRNFHWFSL